MEQKKTSKDSATVNNKNSNMSALPGVNSTLVIPSAPNMIKENSGKQETRVEPAIKREAGNSK
jgi:hypothetical protein